MALRDIRIGEMITHCSQWGKQRELFAKSPFTAPFPDLIATVEEQLVHAQQSLNAAPSPEEKERLRALAAKLDEEFDHGVRSLSTGLRALGVLFPERTTAYEQAHQVAFPEGLGVVNTAWSNEAGEARRLAARIEGNPTVADLLRSSTVNGVPLYTFLERIVDAGTRVGELAIQLDVPEDRSAVSLRAFEARQRWVSMVTTLRRTVDLGGFSDEEQELLLGSVERTSAERARVKAQSQSATPAEPEAPAEV